MNEEDEKPGREHPAKLLIRRKTLQRMQAQSATAKIAHTEAEFIRKNTEWAIEYFKKLEENSWGHISRSTKIPERDTSWWKAKSILGRDLSVPLTADSFNHPTLKEIHKIGTITDVASALHWIRNVPDGNANKHIYQRLRLPDSATGIDVAYFLSIYLEVLDGIAPNWACTDMDLARDLARLSRKPGKDPSPLDIRQYGHAIYAPSWQPGATGLEPESCLDETPAAETEEDDGPYTAP